VDAHLPAANDPQQLWQDTGRHQLAQLAVDPEDFAAWQDGKQFKKMMTEIGCWAEFMALMQRADTMHVFLQRADATTIILKNLKIWMSMMLSFADSHCMTIVKLFTMVGFRHIVPLADIATANGKNDKNDDSDDVDAGDGATPATTPPTPSQFIFDAVRKDMFDRLKFTETKEDTAKRDPHDAQADKAQLDKKRKKTSLSNAKVLAQKILKQTNFNAGPGVDKDSSCVFDEAAQCVFGALQGIPVKDMQCDRIEEVCAALLTFVWTGETTLVTNGVTKHFGKKTGWSALKMYTWELIVKMHEGALEKVHASDAALSTAYKKKRHQIFALESRPVQEDARISTHTSEVTVTLSPKTWETERQELFTDSAWVHSLLQFMEENAMTDRPPQFQQMFINITQALMSTINAEVALCWAVFQVPLCAGVSPSSWEPHGGFRSWFSVFGAASVAELTD
jgi:hypothetical protein